MAIFRHTALHKRAKRDFFERRDILSVLGATLTSFAGLGSHPRFDAQSAMDVLEGNRKSLLEAAFPYLNTKPERVSSKPDYDAIFDELDELVEAYEESKEKSGSVGSDPPK